MTRTRARTEGGRARALRLARRRALPGTLIGAEDLAGATPAAATKALSRLAKQGVLRRVRKGLYYAPRQTPLGESLPTEAELLRKALGHRARPTGLTAANLLGFTTQLPAQPEFAVYATAPPRGIEGARLHLRPRGRAAELDTTGAALLEVLRDRARHSELTAEETCARARAILLDGQPPARSTARLRRLRDAALLEPPRARAILGALLQDAGLPERLWKPLGASLNPLSRFDFGRFRALPNAAEWQAK